MERRRILSIIGGMLIAMLMAEMIVASEQQGTAPSQQQREARRHGRHADGRQERRRRHDGRGKQHRSHVHKWKGHREQRGKQEKAKGGEWKNRWHGGRGFDKHRSHMWNKYGWFWEDETKSWYQCTPIDDPQRGYGCEYKGKWYSMEKRKPSMQRQPQTMPKIEEVEENEDIVEVSEQPMPTVEDVE